MWKKFHMHKHQTNVESSENEVQTNTNQDTLFKMLKIENKFSTEQEHRNNTDGIQQ